MYFSLTDAGLKMLKKILSDSEHRLEADAILQRLSNYEAPDANDERYRSVARDQYNREGEIEIDENAITSPSEEGAYVMAWVWVGREDAGYCINCDEPADNGEGFDGLCGSCADKAFNEDED